MNRLLIVYASVHHKNTEKVVKHIAPLINADVTDILKDGRPDTEAYDTLILASGIYFNAIHRNLKEYIERESFKGKKVILLYTCGARYRDHAKAARKLLIRKQAEYIADVYCRGYDTFGIFGKLGGIAKGHPSDQDMQRLLEQIRRLIS